MNQTPQRNASTAALGALTDEDRAALDFQQQEALNEQARQARRRAWYATRRSLCSAQPFAQDSRRMASKRRHAP